MKVTVIGHWGGYPAKGEATSGYLFQHDGFNLLVDCGSGVISNIQRFIEVEDIHAVVLSHYHYDHMADIGPLQYARLIKTKLHMTEGTIPIYGHAKDPAFDSLTMKTYTKGIAYKEEEELQVGPFTIHFLKTQHPVECYAIKVVAGGKSVVYSGDTSYFKELSTFVAQADLLMCESNLYGGMDGQSAGHMTSIDCGKVAREGKVKQLLLTHLPHFGELPQLVKEASELFKGQIDIATMGWTWEG